MKKSPKECPICAEKKLQKLRFMSSAEGEGTEFVCPRCGTEVIVYDDIVSRVKE